MRRYIFARAVLPLVLGCAPALAQEPAAVPLAGAAAPEAGPAVEAQPSEPAAPAVCCMAPKDTIVQLAIVPIISSKTIKRGDKFEIRLAEPLVIDGGTVLPAGIAGGGEVVHSAPPSFGGKPGELLLAARYLEYNGQRIPLKGMKLGRAGNDNSTAALTLGMVSPIVGFLIQGGHVELPAGTLANAKLAAAITLSPVADPASAPAAESAVVSTDAPKQE